MASRLQDVLLVGIRADQPLPVDVATGTLYAVSDENFLIEQSDGSAWVQYGPAPAVGGITQLTGDVTAGPGSGSQVATLSNTGTSVGTFGSSTQIPVITVNAKGRITASSQVAVSASGGITQLTGDAVAGPGSGSQVLTLNNAYKTRQIGITVDGGGVAITTGIKGYKSFPTNGTIIGVRMLADQVGSAVIDIWKDTYANYPPTIADTIVASAKPTISAANKSEDTTLTGWNTTVLAGDVFGFNVDSASVIQRVTLELTIRVGV